ncbi:MAG: hypothetical protein JWQ57_2047 [Mucilaginibacter sp.]|nr:hypothetical protein [Mucilaginibacter sp.]
MAQFNFTTNTYAGADLIGFHASTLLEADSVSRGLITVVECVKARKVIKKVNDTIVLQTPSDVFNDQGTTALQDESYLDPIAYEFMKEDQFDLLRNSWEVENMKPGAMQDYTEPVDLADFMVNRYKTLIQIANEKLYWNGKGATKEATFSGSYAGLLPLISGNGSTFTAPIPASGIITGATIAATGVVTVGSTANLVSGDVVTVLVNTGTIAETTPGGIAQALIGVKIGYSINVLSSTTFKLIRNWNDTNNRVNVTFTGTATDATISFINASNVIAVLNAMYSQIDPADRRQPDFNILISDHIGRAYAKAQAALATNVLNAFTDPKQMDFLGLKLQLMDYFAPNTIVASRSSNLYLGVDLLSDENTLETADMRIILQNTVRMKARMKSCANAIFFNEIFYLSA